MDCANGLCRCWLALRSADLIVAELDFVGPLSYAPLLEEAAKVCA